MSQRYLFEGEGTQLTEQIRQALYHYGVPTNPSYPNSWEGIGGGASYGVTQKVSVMLHPGGGPGYRGGTSQVYIEVNVQPEFDASAIVLIIVCYLFCLPLGIVLGIFAYTNYQERTRAIYAAAWAPVSNKLVQSQWGTPVG